MGEKAATTTVASPMRAPKEAVDELRRGPGTGERTSARVAQRADMMSPRSASSASSASSSFRVGDTAKARQILCDGPKCSPNVFGVDRTDDDILGAREEYRCWQTLSSNDRPGEGGRTKANAETCALKSVCRLRDVDAEVWEVTGPSARHYARLERLVWRRFFSATLAEESTGDMRR
jgi:hypothetical protein